MTKWTGSAACWLNSDAMMLTRYGAATVSRVVDLDPFALPLAFLFPNATLDAIGHARDVLSGTHVGRTVWSCSPCKAI